MKKLVVTFLTLLTCGAAYALPLGNPTEASLFTHGLCWETSCCNPCDPCFSWCDAWSIRIGFYGDYIYNRHLEVEDGNSPDIDVTELYTNAGYWALNICDRFDIFGTLGGTHLKIRTNASVFSATNSYATLNFDTDFSWSIGARATLWQCNCFGVGIEGQYFQTRPDFDYWTTADTGVINHFDGEAARYRDWQIGLGFSYRLATSCPTFAFVPYAGVKYSSASFQLNNTVNPNVDGTIFTDLNSKKHWGYAVGTSFTMCDMVGVTVEGRWGDEKAFYVNGEFRF